VAESTDLAQADIAVGQPLYVPIAATGPRPSGDCIGIPFCCATAASTARCIRLCHHLPAPPARATVELLVADRFVVMILRSSVLKNRPAARAPVRPLPPKHTMRVEEVARVAAQNGRVAPLSGLAVGVGASVRPARVDVLTL
jgi:hypothetical protein